MPADRPCDSEAMGFLISLVGAVVPYAIRAAEAKFGPKKGEPKKDLVQTIVEAIVSKAREKGEVPKEVGSREISDFIEAQLAAMKATGTLDEADKGRETRERVVIEGEIIRRSK